MGIVVGSSMARFKFRLTLGRETRLGSSWNILYNHNLIIMLAPSLLVPLWRWVLLPFIYWHTPGIIPKWYPVRDLRDLAIEKMMISY